MCAGRDSEEARKSQRELELSVEGRRGREKKPFVNLVLLMLNFKLAADG